MNAMNNRLYCYGVFDDMNPNCLLRCPDKYLCVTETRSRRAWLIIRNAAEELRNERRCYDSKRILTVDQK